MKTKILSLLGLLVIGATAAYGSEQPKMNGKLRVTTLSPEEVLYTGKPYIKELGAYAFNYRNYDPQISRWTTPDPSGFPDGANQYCFIGNAVTSAVDACGLYSTLVKKTDFAVLNTDWAVSDLYDKFGGGSTDRVKDRYRVVFNSDRDAGLPWVPGINGDPLDVSMSASVGTTKGGNIQFGGEIRGVDVRLTGLMQWNNSLAITSNAHQDATPGVTYAAQGLIGKYDLIREEQVFYLDAGGTYTSYGFGWFGGVEATYDKAIGIAIWE